MVQVESGGRMNDILYQLCRHNVSIVGSQYPVPARLIAEHLNLTINQARYRLRKLKQLGLVESCPEIYRDDYSCFLFVGWRLMDKAKETEEYKKAWEEERALCKKCFDMENKNESMDVK